VAVAAVDARPAIQMIPCVLLRRISKKTIDMKKKFPTTMPGVAKSA
jgi:hypothetical protein